MKTKALLTLTALTMVAAPAAATAFAYPHFTEAQNSVQRDDMQAQSFDVYGAEVRLDHVNNKAYVDVYHSHSDNLNNYGYTISHNGKTITSEEVTVQPGISTIEFGSVDDVVFNNGQAEFVFEITEEEHQQGFTFVVDEPVVAEYDATIQKVNGNLRFTISWTDLEANSVKPVSAEVRIYETYRTDEEALVETLNTSINWSLGSVSIDSTIEYRPGADYRVEIDITEQDGILKPIPIDGSMTIPYEGSITSTTTTNKEQSKSDVNVVINNAEEILDEGWELDVDFEYYGSPIALHVDYGVYAGKVTGLTFDSATLHANADAADETITLPTFTVWGMPYEGEVDVVYSVNGQEVEDDDNHLSYDFTTGWMFDTETMKYEDYIQNEDGTWSYLFSVDVITDGAVVNFNEVIITEQDQPTVEDTGIVIEEKSSLSKNVSTKKDFVITVPETYVVEGNEANISWLEGRTIYTGVTTGEDLTKTYAAPQSFQDISTYPVWWNQIIRGMENWLFFLLVALGAIIILAAGYLTWRWATKKQRAKKDIKGIIPTLLNDFKNSITERYAPYGYEELPMLRELTVAQLAEQIEERGLELPKGKKKENFVLAASTLTAEEVKTYDEYIEKQLQVNEETVANNSQEMEDIANKRKKLFSYKKTVILPQESEVEELTFDNLFEDDVEAQYFLLKKEQEEAERLEAEKVEAERLAVEAAEVEEVTEETQYEEVESDEESEETNLGGDLDE